jgi:hypothetical protein
MAVLSMLAVPANLAHLQIFITTQCKRSITTDMQNMDMTMNSSSGISMLRI